MNLLAFFFLSPLLFAAGAACVSIPIIIHLLNKRKFKTVIWAAMDFLLAAQRRNARKLKFRRWLLLALRCLAILMLACGVAQLVAESAVFASFGGGQKAYVIVWDDSYSTGFIPPTATASASAFARSQKALADWLPTLGAADKVMIIHAARAAASDARPTPDKQAVRARVLAAQLSDASTDLPAALDEAATALKDIGPSARFRQLLILTDASNSALRDPSRPADAGASEHLVKALAAASAEATSTRLLDFGTPDQVNMAVTDITPIHPIVVAGTTPDFHVTVLNATDKPALDVSLNILLDGVPAHPEKIARIDPGSSRTLTISVPIPSPGRHTIEVRLPADSLTTDDSRTLLLNVRREIPVLLVDGSPGDNRGSVDSVYYLDRAFKTTPDATAAIGEVFSRHIITELELPTTALPQYAAVFLSDTTAPRSPALLASIKAYVRQGGILIIFPGGHTNAQDMNALFGVPGSSPDAFLPAAIGQPIKSLVNGDVATGIPFAPEGYTHPILQPFGEGAKAGHDYGFTGVQTNQYLKLTPPADGSSEVILRYAKPDGSAGDPAIVSRQTGKGRIILFASTADTSWNSFGPKESFIPIIHELLYYSLPHDSDGLNLHIGQSINLPVDVASAGAWSGPRNSVISVTSEIRDGRSLLVSPPLLVAGRYAPASNTDGRPVIVVNPDAAQEADIRHVTPPALASALKIDPLVITADARQIEPRTLGSGDQAAGDSPSWIAPFLIIAALICVAAETLCALLFSTYR